MSANAYEVKGYGDVGAHSFVAYTPTWYKKALAIGDVTGLGAATTGAIACFSMPVGYRLAFAMFETTTAETAIAGGCTLSVGTGIAGAYIDAAAAASVNMRTLGLYPKPGAGNPMTSVVLGATPLAAAYAAGTTYQIGAVVSYLGVNYWSLTVANVGNTPSTSPASWSPLRADQEIIGVKCTSVGANLSTAANFAGTLHVLVTLPE